MSAPLGIHVEPSGLKKTRPKEYAIRFLFGGIITAITGVIAHFFGPLVGGLFLAFPAILPASVTLLQHHEDHEEASQDALGAAAGGVGLLAFAAAIWFTAASLAGWLSILLAALAWLAVAVVAWAIAALIKRAVSG
jgi:hypothetical protein